MTLRRSELPCESLLGTVRRIAPTPGVTLGRAAAYLATLARPEQAATLRQYGKILRRVLAELDEDTARLDAERP